jgi:hypothetical protein
LSPGANTHQIQRSPARVAVYVAVALAVIGLLNLATDLIGGVLWTVVAFAGAAAALVCANEIRNASHSPRP